MKLYPVNLTLGLPTTYKYFQEFPLIPVQFSKIDNVSIQRQVKQWSRTQPPEQRMVMSHPFAALIRPADLNSQDWSVHFQKVKNTHSHTKMNFKPYFYKANEPAYSNKANSHRSHSHFYMCPPCKLGKIVPSSQAYTYFQMRPQIPRCQLVQSSFQFSPFSHQPNQVYLSSYRTVADSSW